MSRPPTAHLCIVALLATAAIGSACRASGECRSLEGDIRALAVEYSAGCTEDADCVEVPAPTSCYVGCGAVVRAGQEEAFAAALETLEERACPGPDLSGTRCVIYADCSGPLPRCFDGTCGNARGVDPDAGL